MNTQPSLIQSQNMLILTPTDTNFRRDLEEAYKLYLANPAIEAHITTDQDILGKTKKAMRMKDKLWMERKNDTLPGMESATVGEIMVDADKLMLTEGRRRMPPLVVFIYLCIRGQLGSIKSQDAQTFQDESTTLMLFLWQHGIKRPGKSTIIDNLNAMSEKTMEVIFQAQILYIIGYNLDDFRALTIDSTSVEGNTSWPTESSILMRLVKRIYRTGSKLHCFGIEDIQERNFPKIIKDMVNINTTIAFECGKPGSKSKCKALYNKQLGKAAKAKRKFDKEMAALTERVHSDDILPSLYSRLSYLIDMMEKDIADLQNVINYCTLRVMEGKATPSKEKLLSLSDDSTACIAKGGRDLVFGYKPQLGRSKNGFVSALIVPEGNASDSGQLDEAIQTHIRNTGTTPSTVSTDDGYTNMKIREQWLAKEGVNAISFSGSKGKRCTSEEDWNSEEYGKLRNDRSAVESLMYCLKYGFHFGRVMRRGIENVRKELMEKVLAYNFRKIVMVRKRLQLSV